MGPFELSILTHPRAMVRLGDYYGPEPRKLSTYKPDSDNYGSRFAVD